MYPKLNVHVNSVAVQRDKGSSVVVSESGDTRVELDLSPERVVLKNVVLRDSKTNHRPLPVQVFADEDTTGELSWLNLGCVAVSQRAVELLERYYPKEASKADEAWFSCEDLQAYTALDVYTEGVLRARLLELRSGSRVAVRVDE